MIVLQGDFFGFDQVLDTAGDDEIHWHGVSASQVERIRFNDTGFGSPDLFLRVLSTGQMLDLSNWFTDPSFQIERIVFDDGTVWTAAETSALRLFGTEGNDSNLNGTQWSRKRCTPSAATIRRERRWRRCDRAAGRLLRLHQVLDTAGDDEIHWHGVSAGQVERIRFNDTGFGSPDLFLRVLATGQMLDLSKTGSPTRASRSSASCSTTARCGGGGDLGTAPPGHGGQRQPARHRVVPETLDGGAGADTMQGGAGADLYIVDDAGDSIVENAGEGIDSVESSVSVMMLWDDVENVTLVGAGLLGSPATTWTMFSSATTRATCWPAAAATDADRRRGRRLPGRFRHRQRPAGRRRRQRFHARLEGDDVYEAGIGQDWIYDNGGDDEVRLAAGIARTRSSWCAMAQTWCYASPVRSTRSRCSTGSTTRRSASSAWCSRTARCAG